MLLITSRRLTITVFWKFSESIDDDVISMILRITMLVITSAVSIMMTTKREMLGVMMMMMLMMLTLTVIHKTEKESERKMKPRL